MPMTREELAETLLKMNNIFDFLQFVDESYESKNSETIQLVDEFIRQRYQDKIENTEGILPFVQLKTGIVLLMLNAFFAANIEEEKWKTIEFSIRSQYDICFSRKGRQISNPSVTDVIKTIRNACAHLPDLVLKSKDLSNVSFSPGIVTFFSKQQSSSLTFSSKNGYILFLNDYLRAIRKLVRENLLVRPI